MPRSSSWGCCWLNGACVFARRWRGLVVQNLDGTRVSVLSSVGCVAAEAIVELVVAVVVIVSIDRAHMGETDVVEREIHCPVLERHPGKENRVLLVKLQLSRYARRSMRRKHEGSLKSRSRVWVYVH